MKDQNPFFELEEEEVLEEELEELERSWSGRMERFTIPVPTLEQSLQLISSVKASVAPQQTALRAELEAYHRERLTLRKLCNLFLAQWNVYGGRSWLLTALLMALSTVGTITYLPLEPPIFVLIKWVSLTTLIMILSVSYAFWPKNEGMEILEKLSAYTLMQQLSARFVLVVGFHMIVSVPLASLIGSESASIGGLLLSWSIPMLFFGVTCFVIATLLSTKAAIGCCLLVWSIEVLFHEHLKVFDLFSAPGDLYFLESRWVAFGIILLLLSLFYNKKRWVGTSV
ncbi:hypothetical protein [Tumebacillus lipolyticus]|uniref:Uncharacterized protein n=1 Tax=Tumebacillus lipolyticus TaxID=1280370 RepID=A0ABW4ZSF5_9BACL